LLESIRRTEARGALETAHRCLGYCGQIFRYAIATVRAQRNHVPALRGALPPVKSTHFASITDPNGIGGLYGERVFASRGAMARAAKSQGRA
jgi:hypothetical protein